MKSIPTSVLALLPCLVGCAAPAPSADPPKADPVATEAPAATTIASSPSPLASVAPSVAPSTEPSPPAPPSSPHARPAFEDPCASNGDCEAIMPGIAGSDLCCPGCEWKAVNKSSLTRFRADCKASPPAMCPPLGCAAPIVHAECRAKHCVIVPDK